MSLEDIIPMNVWMSSYLALYFVIPGLIGPTIYFNEEIERGIKYLAARARGEDVTYRDMESTFCRRMNQRLHLRD